ncbi:hypothetical protein D3C81_1770490 [compost metagenome]
MIAHRKLRLLAEDHVEVFQARAIFGQLATANGSACLAITALFGIRQVNGTVLGKLG